MQKISIFYDCSKIEVSMPAFGGSGHHTALPFSRNGSKRRHWYVPLL